MVYTSLLMLAGGLILMFFSSKMAIRYAIGISESLALGRFAVGFIFIAMTTALPEIFVSVSSILHGEPGLAVGNALGSVFANLSIILGLAVLLGGTMRLRRTDLGGLVEILFVSSLVSVFILQAGSLSVVQGLILLALFVLFINRIKREKIPMERKPDFFAFLGSLAKFLPSVAFLLLSSELIVRGAVDIVQSLFLKPEFIGLTLVAVGTSLPELAVGVRSIRAGEYALGLGDLFGSSVIDITFIMGFIALLNPVPVNLAPVSGVLPFMLFAILINWYLLSKGGHVTRQVALFLIVLFFAFLLEQIGILTLFA